MKTDTNPQLAGPTGLALEETLAAEGVFKGFEGLEGFAECDSFWEQQPYGKRLYYGSGGLDYLHRDVLRAAIRALKKPNDQGSATLKDQQQISN